LPLHGAANRRPTDFANLLLVPGVGPRTVEALALVAEVVHGTPCRFSDPARFSLAQWGKDAHPFPVPLAVYDETIRTLKSAVRKATLGREEELAALKRLDDQARQLERYASGPTWKNSSQQNASGRISMAGEPCLVLQANLKSLGQRVLRPPALVSNRGA
jgi:hypothetical protein